MRSSLASHLPLEVSAEVVGRAAADQVEDVEVGAFAAVGVGAAAHIRCLLAASVAADCVIVALHLKHACVRGVDAHLVVGLWGCA